MIHYEPGRRWALYRTLIAALLVLASAGTTSAQDSRGPRQAPVIQGQVTASATGRPLAGARVSLAGTEIAVLTDAAGRYSIPGIPAGELVVEAEYLGYKKASRSLVHPGEGAVTVDLGLSEEPLALDGIVVTGTAGQARRREVGNSIAQIDISEVADPIASVDQLLQGRGTSVSVTSAGASFGSGSAIRLRGNVSLSLSNQPLIFVDGVRQTAESYPLNASQASFPHYGPGAVMSPLNDINPNDIERIEIVKGAAATTLYGSEASAGVIQIFTRKGRSGEPTWTLQTDHGLDWVKPFGSEQRPYINLDPWLKTAYGTRNTLSVSGGRSDLRYFVSAGYDTGEGVLPNDREDRLALRLNLDLDARPGLTFQLNTAYTSHDLEITHTGNSGMALPFNAFRQPNNSFGSSDPELLGTLLDAEIGQANQRFTAGLTANWTPWEPLTQRFTVGLDRITSRGTQYRPLGFLLDPAGSISDIRWTSSTVTIDYVGNLRWLQGDALASTLSWGAQSTTTEESKVDAFGTGFPGPGRHTLSSTADRFIFGSESRIVTAGLFFHNLFGIHDRIFITTGARIDGSSTFGERLGLQFYPKVSASYVISDESFWERSWGEVKVRAAVGYAGRAPGAFDAVRTWQPFSFDGTSAFRPGNVGNPDLGPERTRELELGFDASWFDGRLRADLTWYDQVTTDALFPVNQTPSLGFTGSQLENVGRLANRGLELSLHGTPYQGRDLIWNLGGSISTNRSKVLEVGNTTAYNIQVGQPAPVVRGTLVLNADRYEDPILVTDHFFGPNQPTLQIGINSELHLPRGLRLSARGEYQGGHYITDSASDFMVDRGAGAPGCDNAYEHVPFDSYPNGNLEKLTALERARCYRENRVSGLWIYPADFFKLRELTLTAPVARFVPGTESATLSLSLRNAFRWTNSDFLAFDPEMVSSRENTRALTTGITEHAPAPARFVASLRIVF